MVAGSTEFVVRWKLRGSFLLRLTMLSVPAVGVVNSHQRDLPDSLADSCGARLASPFCKLAFRLSATTRWVYCFMVTGPKGVETSQATGSSVKAMRFSKSSFVGNGMIWSVKSVAGCRGMARKVTGLRSTSVSCKGNSFWLV